MIFSSICSASIEPQQSLELSYSRFLADQVLLRPVKYFEELQRYANIVTDVPLIEVTSTKTDRFQALEEMQALNRNSASESPLPYPFHGNSVDQVYQDFQARLSPPLYSGALEPFTYNTFAVVDIDCVISRPWKCVVCTDAIAFVEGEPHEELKQLRMPLGEELCTALGTIEAMVVAPNEVHDSQGQPYWPSP